MEAARALGLEPGQVADRLQESVLDQVLGVDGPARPAWKPTVGPPQQAFAVAPEELFGRPARAGAASRRAAGSNG